jgi:hypothetical protein
MQLLKLGRRKGGMKEKDGEEIAGKKCGLVMNSLLW